VVSKKKIGGGMSQCQLFLCDKTVPSANGTLKEDINFYVHFKFDVFGYIKFELNSIQLVLTVTVNSAENLSSSVSFVLIHCNDSSNESGEWSAKRRKNS
jgi:hypothetical protein